jgi:hypothetical protein
VKKVSFTEFRKKILAPGGGRPKFPILSFLVSVGRVTFFDKNLQNSKKRRLIIDNQGLIYLPITKSLGLLAPTAENPAMNYE